MGRIVKGCLILTTVNIVLVRALLGMAGMPSQLIVIFSALFYLSFLVAPEFHSGRADEPRRLRTLKNGHTQLSLFAWCFAAELLIYVGLFFRRPETVGWQVLLANGLLALLFLFFVGAAGFFRVVLTSGQLGIILRLLLIFTWWIPLWNIFLLCRACGIVKREYYFEMAKLEKNDARRESGICATKYPVLLVHGIFFRDWQFLNYWGRIPKELERNGAVVFYGKQQSAAPVAKSGGELADRIREIVEKEGCGKVNIIAHSKGGLDSRYAISALGMAPCVASLTTVNTPHRGCVFAEKLLAGLPAGLVRFVAERYNGIFRRLGDENPDFLGGVRDLTASACKKFNEETPDREEVVYQSVASKMRGMTSAGFPLCLSYPLARVTEGENDGLVSPKSAVWGDFLCMAAPKGRRGISHGDMVDLMRENIPGFDVREFYVEIVSGLAEKGL